MIMTRTQVLEALERRLSEMAYAENLNEQVYKHEYIANQMLLIVEEANKTNLQKMDEVFQEYLQSALTRNDSTCYNLTEELYEQFTNLFGGYIESAYLI